MNAGRDTTRPPRLPELIANQIEETLFEGGLRVGQTLPTEPQLAEKYGVSRTVVREAARILEQRGLVDIRSGRGMTVLDLDGAPVARHYSLMLRANPAAFDQLMDVRMLIETSIAGLAARHRSQEDIDALHDSIEIVRNNRDDARICLDQDLRFHALISHASGNPMMALFVDPVNQCLRESYQPDFEYLARLGDTIDEHVAILDAIERHDVDQAERLTRVHLERVKAAGVGGER